ncbi:MAG: guanylate kinase [Alphaproteobacteria bacterium]|jgi:guanylate kinase|nr:guanylate kinase [Candidatus Jidaibacter sp.]
MAHDTRRGVMVVISSPSGAGKTTLANLVLQSDKHIHPSISYTTREKRPGEVHGTHYYFTDRATFKQMEQDSKFLESAEVFDHLYGTPKDVVESYLQNGDDIIFDIDWQGHRSLKALAPEDVVSIFLLPPSKKELKERLSKRAQDTHETIMLRMQKANSELQHWKEYDYVIVNKDLKESLNKLLSILRAERLRKNRRVGLFEFVQQMIDETA